MDRDWMREQLTTFVELAARHQSATPYGVVTGDRALYDELHRREPTVERILQRLDPNRAAIDIDQVRGMAKARNDAHRGLGILADIDEWDRRLAPDAPVLPADQLHPWVWDAARTLWQSEHYRLAVQAAATAINAHTQTKVGRRDVSDDKLIQEAFSEKPPGPDGPRLRFPGDPSDPTVQSGQRGALLFGLGCFFAIRNPATHMTNEWSEQEALEKLAALSVLARMIDFCDVDYG